MFRQTPNSSSSGLRLSLARFEDLHRLLHPLKREVLRLGGEDGVGRGDQRIDREEAERRWAVDQDQVPAAPQVAEGVAKRHLAPDLPGEHELGLGEAEVCRDHSAVNCVGGPRLPLEHVAERGLRAWVGIEVVGEVSLGISVDRQHVQIETCEDVGQRAHQGRLSSAALLR